MRTPILALLVTGACAAAGDGDVTATSRPLAPFARVENRSALDVDLQVGPDPTALVTCDRNLQDLIRLDIVDGDRLRISTGGRLAPRGACSIGVSTPSLDEASVGGGGTLTIAGDLAGFSRAEVRGLGDLQVQGASGPPLDLFAGGRGELRALASTSDNVTLTVSGAGGALLTGVAQDVEVTTTGAGPVDAVLLEADRVVVDLSGAGDVDVYARESVMGQLTGKGSLRVHGGADVQVLDRGAGVVEEETEE